MQGVRRLVVGLGNPGPDYHRTRHNVGFELLDLLALREGLLFETSHSPEELAVPSNLAWAHAIDPPGLLVKPLTFMNRSGEAVGPLLSALALEPEDMFVVYDDMDLAVGDLRIRPHGGAGGQNGMRSILETLQTDRFPRLRIGIGRPATDAARHVLSPFPDEERKVVDASLEEAAEALFFWLRTGDVERCMSRFHSRWKKGLRPEARTHTDE